MFFGSMGGMDDFGGFKTRSSTARAEEQALTEAIEDEIKIGLVEAFRYKQNASYRQQDNRRKNSRRHHGRRAD